MFHLNSEFPLRDQGVSNALNTGDLARHRWYFVKEGFSPLLVEQAIQTDALEEGDVLLDPFSGSGTVPLSGAMAGMKTRSFEINPFLHFLSSTKLQHADGDAVIVSSRTVTENLKKPRISPLEGTSTFTDGNRWDRWLFPRDVLRSFEGGRLSLSEVPARHRGLLRLALIGAAMDCCNAFRDGKCLRYLPNWKKNEATPDKLTENFEKRLEMIVMDLSKAPLPKNEALVTSGDARRLVGSNSQEKFRMCITSPPYLNSFDYSDVYRPELFLGGFVKSNAELMKIRLRTVRSHIQASWKSPTKCQFGRLYNECIAKLRDVEKTLWSSRIPEMVQAYFEDIEAILSGLRRKALPEASVWLVVSTSAYGNVEIPVDLILAEIGQRSGWYLREVGVLRYLRSSSQHSRKVEEHSRKAVPLRESVVILDAKPKR